MPEIIFSIYKAKETKLLHLTITMVRLFLTLPISWRGRVKQYAGRLHRDYHEKKEIRIYDYLDQQIDLAMKMYRKRCKGYRSMGYEIMDLQKNELEEQKK